MKGIRTKRISIHLFHLAIVVCSQVVGKSLATGGGVIVRCLGPGSAGSAAVSSLTSRAGELRSAPSGPDDRDRVAGKRALAPGVRVRRERALK